jgi:hypothetical protein
MRKILTAALAALTIGGAIAATTTSANADPRGGWHGGGYGGWRHGDRGDAGLAIGAGILGLAVGASLAQPHYAYGPGYYAGPGYYGYPGECRVHYRFDPYAGRYIPVERCY